MQQKTLLLFALQGQEVKTLRCVLQVAIKQDAEASGGAQITRSGKGDNKNMWKRRWSPSEKNASLCLLLFVRPIYRRERCGRLHARLQPKSASPAAAASAAAATPVSLSPGSSSQKSSSLIAPRV